MNELAAHVAGCEEQLSDLTRHMVVEQAAMLRDVDAWIRRINDLDEQIRETRDLLADARDAERWARTGGRR